MAPDSFKGSIDAVAAAAALAAGWLSVRPQDEVLCLPQADGGEGTAEVLATVFEGATWREVGPVIGPDGRVVEGRYLLIPDGTAVIDLATGSGIALMEELDPLGAHTVGLGQILRRAVEDGARRLVVGLGGSASTDGGLGALTALGARAWDHHGQLLPNGGGALVTLERIDWDGIVQPPSGGVEVLTDVTSPLLGESGAAAVFGPQKGATPDDIELLNRGLSRLAAVIRTERPGADPSQAGAGAAGGTGFGLSGGWGAKVTPGARRVAELTGLAAAAPTANVLILGEGRFDATSLTGKVVGEALNLAGATTRPYVVAGQIGLEDPAMEGIGLVSLSQVAGSTAAALAEPAAALERAARQIAAAANARLSLGT
jgi:glycerate kinase